MITFVLVSRDQYKFDAILRQFFNVHGFLEFRVEALLT